MFMVKKSKDINLGDIEKTRILLCFNFVYLIIISNNCFGVAWMAVWEVFLSRKSCKSNENTFPKDSLLGRNWPPDLMFATPALSGWWSDAKRLSRMFNLLNTQWNIFPECIKSLFKKGFKSLKKTCISYIKMSHAVLAALDTGGRKPQEATVLLFSPFM